MSGDLIQLWDKGVLLQGIWETIYLTFISSFVAYVFGLPIGVLLTVTIRTESTLSRGSTK